MKFQGISICFILLLSFTLSYAQQSGAVLPRINNERRTDPNRQDAATQRWYEELARRENQPTGIQSGVRIGNVVVTESVFAGLRREALKNLEPTIEEKQEFEDFLKQPRTGLIKIAAENDCSKMVDASRPDNQCLNYYLPGKARAYSFRQNRYTHQAFADFERMKGNFITPGTYILGLMATFGDTPIETVTPQNENIVQLLRFAPPDKIEEILIQDKQILAGLKLGNLTYRKVLPIQEKTTYLLRSIAYNAKFKNLPKNDDRKGSLDEDDRSDIIVVFRVVKKDFNDNLLLLWKEISKKKAPKIEVDMAQS